MMNRENPFESNFVVQEASTGDYVGFDLDADADKFQAAQVLANLIQVTRENERLRYAILRVAAAKDADKLVGLFDAIAEAEKAITWKGATA